MDKNASNKPRNKIPEGFKKFLYIFIFVFSIVLLVVEGIIYYHRSYLTPFWVNGQSMYPTLNEHAKNAQGDEIGAGGGGSLEGYTVDYGKMDCHKSAINKIKRFDVVVTLYSSDDTSNKIKRVIGMPGETIKFSTAVETNGDLYVNGKFVEQPISTQVVRNASYPVGEIKLGENEYYVLGDNRNHSLDSRAEGPIKKEWITGKAMYLTGTATVFKYTDPDSGNFKYDIKNIKKHWPRRIK
jgi:signal peptidase I